MIYIAKPNAKEKDFTFLLEQTRKLALVFLAQKKNISPLDFETVIFEQMCKAAEGSNFAGQIQQTKAHAFPDIIANKYFGVEVKMTLGNHWTSTGNSVLESLREEDIGKIYIVFGKFGGTLDIRYRLYQECLPEISVTHSPRYRINMDLPAGKSIFDKMGIDYNVLREDKNAIKKIKNYYRGQLKEGEELWWIDQDSEDKPMSPVIKPFRMLNTEQKENFIIEAMILFPEIFGNSPTKFERAAAYLITEYNAISKNIRDPFSANGQVELKIKGKNVVLPRIAGHLHSQAKAVEAKIKTINIEKIKFYWRSEKIEKDRLEQWKKLLDEKFALTKFGTKASDIFVAGLL